MSVRTWSGSTLRFTASRAMTGRVARYVWALPNTLVGLLLVPAAAGGGLRVVDGALELHGPVIARLLRTLVPIPGGAAAMTLGHIVLGRDRASLAATRAHERVHVRQCERWGPAFIPAYLLASTWAWLRGRGGYEGNWFEREARAYDEGMLLPKRRFWNANTHHHGMVLVSLSPDVSRVLDVGCGDGILSAELIDAGVHHVVGLDVDQARS